MLSEELSRRPEEFAAWIATYYYANFKETAQSLALRRDAITLLTYARDHKVTGTKSTGNMPLKHIRAVTAEFVTPPSLDDQIGDRVYKLRTEFDVWPLLFIHILLEVAELLETPMGARWRLTDAGERFLEDDPLFQTLTLFSTWWHRVDWHVALRHGIELPATFPTAASALLKSQPIGTWVDFEAFATTLLQRTGLWQTLPDPLDTHQYNAHHRLLLWDVRKTVIDRLIDFGVVEAQYKYEIEIPGSSGTLKQLGAFRLTWFGRAMLDGLKL